MDELNRFQRARLAKVLNYQDARRYARQALPRGVFEYVDGGAEDEVTLRRNLDAFQRLSLRPRMGVWVPKPKLGTELFGERIAMPVLTAPCGGMKLIHPSADIGVARGAATAGTMHVVSAASGSSLEEIAQTADPKWFQLYSLHGRAGMENLVGRAQAAGYRALVVTVDTAVVGRRERDLRNGFSYSMRINAWNALRLGPQLARRPLWSLRYVRDGMPFDMANTAAMTDDGVPLLLTEMTNGEVSQSPSWADISWVRDHWKGPMVIKGVLTAEDARRAVNAGCDGIIVSNHGGRQLEGAPATIDALREVVAAVGASTEILLDSGVRRGADVVKAIGLGAKAVLIGRPYIWGLALGGPAGVRHMLELLRGEMIRTMQLMGCESVEQLDPSWITKDAMVTAESRYAR